ncbi:hypothetical protein [Vibrio genomosp. F10]|uniref:hypothetical protein n=1 Tax=Vibrio genomosp. F10 TaxID=723171 RepID=UPI00037844CF|nr:hypothetical protein [Vibrio genomosp. F10]OEE95071.1 hypothetical protein A1QK_15750 [Vibrio genomosp. F10 str. 9ZD137]
MINYKTLLLTALPLFTFNTFAEEVAAPDMSDPTAVYTSVGVGYGTSGYNAKIGLKLPSTSSNEANMLNLEVKNGGDTFRGRFFNVDNSTGGAISVDAGYDRNSGVANISAGALTTLPLSENIVFYPGLYLGGMIGDRLNVDNHTTGVDIKALTATGQLYTNFKLTDKLWLNVNPSFTTSLYGIKTDTFDLEVAIGYQITPVFNARFYHNNNVGVGHYDKESYKSMTRLEFNYAF